MAPGLNCLLDCFSVIAKFHKKDKAVLTFLYASMEFRLLQSNVLIVLHLFLTWAFSPVLVQNSETGALLFYSECEETQI